MDLHNSVAIVTGGAQGIGKSCCLALLEGGCKVCICDVNERSGMKLLNDVSRNFHENVIFVKCDVSVWEECNAAFMKTTEKFGYVDILINNAGVVDERDWKKIINVNFVGVINGIHLAFQHMGINNGGRGGVVINTASNAGINPFPLGPVYCGSKHGVVGLTKSYGSDLYLKTTGVKVSAVCPGPVDTDLFHGFPENTIYEDLARIHNSSVKPIGPEKVASAMMQLLKDGKNGALLKVDIDGVQYIS